MLTREELDIKYGNVKVRFYRYYKYSFFFKGITDNGEDIFCSVGGDANDIYRFEMIADFEVTVGCLYPYEVTIMTKTGSVKESFYENP